MNSTQFGRRKNAFRCVEMNVFRLRTPTLRLNSICVQWIVYKWLNVLLHAIRKQRRQSQKQSFRHISRWGISCPKCNRWTVCYWFGVHFHSFVDPNSKSVHKLQMSHCHVAFAMALNKPQKLQNLHIKSKEIAFVRRTIDGINLIVFFRMHFSQ